MTGECLYGKNYAENFVLRSLKAPYTEYKNSEIAKEVAFLGKPYVLDVGGNVNGIIKYHSSLRYQLEKKGIRYLGLDLSSVYFSPDFARQLSCPNVYPQVNGIVGNANRLPFANQDVDCVVCADVLEHISNPLEALREISRVIKPDGRVIITVPSMYKLDALKFSHIIKKRRSTHKNRLALQDWMNLFEQADLSIIPKRSKPLGILSGLSYLVWLDENFIPQKKHLEGSSTYSKKAKLHADAKKVLSEIDPITDKYYQQNPDKQRKLQEFLKNGDISGLFQQILNDAGVFMNDEAIEIVKRCFNKFNPNKISRSQYASLRDYCNQANNNAFIGNSAFLVLEKV